MQLPKYVVSKSTFHAHTKKSKNKKMITNKFPSTANAQVKINTLNFVINVNRLISF